MAPRSTSDLDGEDDSPLDKTQMAAIWSVGNSPIGLFFFVVRTGLYVPVLLAYSGSTSSPKAFISPCRTHLLCTWSGILREIRAQKNR